MTYLTKIQFDDDSENFAGQGGYQETSSPSFGLIHLYDEKGDQLDAGNGYFPNASWGAISESVEIEDCDDFWNVVITK